MLTKLLVISSVALSGLLLGYAIEKLSNGLASWLERRRIRKEARSIPELSQEDLDEILVGEIQDALRQHNTQPLSTEQWFNEDFRG